MKRLLFLILFVITLGTINAQSKTQYSIGTGLIINQHKQANYHSWYSNFLNETRSISFSYGANANITYNPIQSFFLRSGLHFSHVQFEGYTLITSANSLMIPGNIGLRWGPLAVYTGLEYERTFYGFRHSENFVTGTTEENCACDLTRNNLNTPLGAELKLTNHFLIGYKHQFLFNTRGSTRIRVDRLRNSYLYVNYVL